MLNIFKRIRQKLIDSGSVTKYLLYAAGEILLVVIGILIALQVNNWNEERKDRILEQRYLERLQTELQTDLNEIGQSRDVNILRKERAEFLMNSVNQPELARENPTYMVESIEYAGYTNSPGLSDNTFEEMKSAGNLSVIRNEELRTIISEYYARMADRGQYNFITQEIQLRYLDNRIGILTAEQQIEMGSFGNRKEYSIEEAEEAYQRMTQKEEFVEWIPYVIQSKIRTSENLDAMYENTDDLIRLIEAERNVLSK